MFIISEVTDFEIEDLVVAANSLQLTLRSRLAAAQCPICTKTGLRVQSCYFRTLGDLPASGYQVKLHLLVRRFYCDNPACKRRIFAQRFPALTCPRAQRTNRVNQTLLQMGLVLGGEAGAALAKKLGMIISPDTLLRLIRSNKPVPLSLGEPSLSLTKVGIDDWSWKKGVSYGTIIVNLDNHRVVDLLPDRTTNTVKEWLLKHPGIEVISRDRSTEYALAATKGAPQAIQVADRFHIVRNLAEHVELLLARLRKEWRPALELPAQVAVAENKLPPTLPDPVSWKAEPSHQNERKRLARRAERMDRYQQVVQLRTAGLTQREIVERTGISEQTIRKWLKAPAYPETHAQSKRGSIFDRYAGYVLRRWQEGQHDGQQLWVEIAAQGFKGTARMVQRFLQQLRNEKRQPLSLPAASPLEGLKARQAVWWFIREASKLKEEEIQNLKLLRETSPELDEVYALVQSFMGMLHQLQGEEHLEEWLGKVRESIFEELHSFARGIEKDKAAVLAGLSLSYSNGLTEGHNNRLKLIKRSMFGRGKLDLLKQRVLANAA
jgi:transposase